jgi:hypothetical protein
VSVKKEQGITSHLMSEIVNNGATYLIGDILFFLYAHFDASFTRIKIWPSLKQPKFQKAKLLRL